VPEPNVRDRRVQRTQRLLQDSLRALLQQKPFDEIVVLDITEAANVNRATFYDHYADKLDLFNALIAADFRQLLELRNVCFDGTCASGLGAILLAVGDFLEQLHKDRRQCTRHSATGPLIDAAITLAIRKILLDGLTTSQQPEAPPQEIVASLLSGAIYGAVKQWMSSREWRVDEQGLLTLVPLIQPLLPPHAAAPATPR
jgi:AcrR family transcriptional regulator